MSLFGPPNIVKMVERCDGSGLIKALHYRGDKSIRIQAANALGNLKDQKAVDPFLQMMEEPDVDIRNAALEALGKIGDPRAVPYIKRYIYPLRRSYLTDNSFKALIAIGDPGGRAIIELLADGKANIRDELFDYYKAYTDPRAAECILTGLTYPDATARRWTATLLGVAGKNISSETIKKNIVEKLFSTLGDGEMARNSISALGDIGNIDALHALQKLLNDWRCQYTHAVASAISKIENPESAKILLEALRTYKGQTQKTIDIVSGLAGTKDPVVVGYLIELMESTTNLNIKKSIFTTLNYIYKANPNDVSIKTALLRINNILPDEHSDSPHIDGEQNGGCHGDAGHTDTYRKENFKL